jgi:hypothetical protein
MEAGQHQRDRPGLGVVPDLAFEARQVRRDRLDSAGPGLRLEAVQGGDRTRLVEVGHDAEAGIGDGLVSTR